MPEFTWRQLWFVVVLCMGCSAVNSALVFWEMSARAAERELKLTDELNRVTQVLKEHSKQQAELFTDTRALITLLMARQAPSNEPSLSKTDNP